MKHPCSGILALVLAVLALGASSLRAGAAASVAVSVQVAGSPSMAPSLDPASTSRYEPALVEVSLGDGVTLGDLIGAGLDVVDVKGTSVRVLARPSDAKRFERLGITPRMIDPSPGSTAAARSRAELAARPVAKPTSVWSATGTDGRFRTQLLPPFGSGSMGGFWTAAEIKMKLDALVASDVQNLVANKIDTVGYTHRGRPVWGLKIAKAVGGTDTRPVVFLNALTHSREPESMQALLYFVDDLLAKYGTDPFATHLLDRRVIYIVPLVNPDGYAVNESTYTASGGTSFGFWRKNTRDNNGNSAIDDQDGVDLNRNFGYLWGLNDSGSSPAPSSEIYRGPSAFSEPETQAQRNLVNTLKPVTGFSFHSFGDIFIHSWGYTTTPAPHAAAFAEWSDHMSRDNAYMTGSTPSILYDVNGDFNDWAYGDTLMKPRAFTWTPEIGHDVDGFWPPPSRIVPLAQEMLRPCYVLAGIAGAFVQEGGVTLLEGVMNAGRLTNVVVQARNLGAKLGTGTGLTGVLLALDAGAHVLNGTVLYPAAGPRQSVAPLGGSAFQVALDDSVTPGRLMRFEVAFTSSEGFGRDTIVVPAGTPTLLASDNASGGIGGWQLAGNPSPSWSIVTGDPAHPSAYFSERGADPYQLLANDRLILRQRLNLSAGVHAYALFEAKWDFQEDFDYGSIEASTDSVTWVELRATGTTPGSGLGVQVAGKPYYAGNRRVWQSELADLSPFTGPTRTRVHLRFRGRADEIEAFDGLSMDSLRIVIYDPAAQPTPVAVESGALPAALELGAPTPNPMSEIARFDFALPRAGNARLEILDVMGRRVRTLANGAFAAGRYVHGWNRRDDRGARVAPGVYLARLTTPAGEVVRRVVALD